MINILTGRGGLWEPLAGRLKAAYHRGNECVLLVPEQYTLQAERDALSALHVPGFFRLQVLSPSRFSNYVFERAGRDPRPVIDERGRLMTMARALSRAREDLVFYAGAKEKAGLAHKLTEAVGELKGAGVTPEGLLLSLSGEAEDPKLRDLARLYGEYEALLAGQLMDREGGDRELLRRFGASGLFCGADFFVFGFDLLSEPLIRVLAACAGRARDMTVALVMEGEDAPDGDAFEPVRRSLVRFQESLRALGLPWKTERLADDGAGKPAALTHLANHLLRMKPEPFPGSPECLRLFAGRTPHDEVRRAAALIKAELGAGTEPENIAVILADEGYALLLPGVFQDYRVPHYLAVKEPILAHALVRCLLDALTCIQSAAWRPEDMIGYAKSPFSPLTREEAFRLENWALRCGIKGRRWTQPNARGEEPERSELEALRAKAVKPLMTLRDALAKAGKASDSVRAVIAFLEELDAHGQIIRLEKTLQEKGMQEESIRTRQVWDKLCGMLTQMDELLGEDRIPMARFPDWLREGLSMTELSTLPPGERRVQVGTLGALMTRKPEAVFILGLNNGALNLKDETLLGDRERADLEKRFKTRMNLPLSLREMMKGLDLWKAAASATSRLYLSYALSSEQGEPLGALAQLARLQKTFPRLIEEGGAVGGLRDPAPLAPAAALDEVALRLFSGEMEGPWREAWAALQGDPAWAPQAGAVKAAFLGDDPDKRLDKDISAALFYRRTVSVSRLETYAGCPFRHFVQYGLKPQERKEWRVEPAEFGSFCHAAMEGYVRRLEGHPAWPEVSREESDAIMDGALDELTADWENGPWADTPRARKAAEAFKDVCRRTAWALSEGGAQSAFRPAFAELRFGMDGGLPGMEIALHSGETLTLRGTIDRIDAARLQGGDYLRVVDYKTGGTALNASDLAAGAQLQLLLYLKAALRLMEGYLPAGAFYQPMKDPVVRAETPKEAVKKGREKLRLSGVLLGDPEVLKLMDAGDPPVSLSNYVNKSGETLERDRLLTAEGLRQLMDAAENAAKRLAEGIFSGLIPRAPLFHASGRAECAFCDFKGVCRQDKLSREPLARRAKRLNFDDLLREGGAPRTR